MHRPFHCLTALVALGTALSFAPGSVVAADCVDTSPADAQAAIEDARRAILTLEYEPTLAKLDEVRKSLPCLTGTVPQESLAQLYFFTGLMQFSLEKKVEAKESFQDAAAIQALLQEDREQGTEVRELWAMARDEITRTTGTLTLPDLPKESVAYLDGKPLQSGVQSVSIYPGVHLLQIQGDDRKLHGTLMRVRPGETSLVPAEFLASLTPRGELVLDVRPRRSKVLIRQGNTVVYNLPRAARRTTIPDVKEGAYIVEVTRAGYYPFSQGKVAVEGSDQTVLSVALERRPSVSLYTRGGVFWVSAPDDAASNPLGSIELVGRNTQGWGVHLEYLYHIADESQLTPYEDNPDHEPDQDPSYDDDIDHWPPKYPNVTTKDLPIGAQFYLGVSRQFRIEGVDIGVGPKLGLDLNRGSLFAEVYAGYDFVPWVGINIRAGLGTMWHLSEHVYDALEDEQQSEYLKFGMVGMVNGGLKVGF